MFTDTLKLDLKLTHGGNTVSIVGGNITAWDLDLHNWGFRGKVVFRVSLEKQPDPLFDVFITPDLLAVSLSITPHHIPKGVSVEPLVVQGLVTRKALVDEQINPHAPSKKSPLFCRIYEVEFADPAQVRWRWHHPFDLMVDKSVKDLLMAHKTAGVDLECTWDRLEETWPVLSLALGMDRGGASFYDFVLWYVRAHNGVFTYDAAANAYALTAEKTDAGKPAALNRQWVDAVRVDFPEPPRHTVRGLNADADNPRQEEISNPDAMEGIWIDYLDRFPVASDFDGRQAMEQKRLITRSHEVRLIFNQYPLLTAATGSLIKLEGELWGEHRFTEGKTYRIRSLHCQARAENQEVASDVNAPANHFAMDLQWCLEPDEEKWVDLPAFIRPQYPFLVEGRVVSEQGEEEAQTYQLYEDGKTSRIHYKIKIPLWDDQVVVAPFDPTLHSGHFYFPGYKRARALVALDFQAARIVQWLDWHDEAQLPADTQGNRILMGWTPASRTAISHTYVNSLPVFAVERLADKDTESITMSDGSMVLQTREKKE